MLMRGNRTYTIDGADRSDSDTVGGPFRVDANSQPRVRSGRFEFKSMSGNPGRAGNWVSAPGAETDNYEVEAQLASPSTAGTATDNYTAIQLTVPDTYGSGTMAVYFVVSTGSGCAIMSQSGTPPTSTGISTGQTGQTQRTTSPGNLGGPALIRLRRQMYSATQSLFTAFVNDIQVSQWDDSGGLVPSGAAHRRFGFIVEGNHPFLGSDYRSLAIDWISCRDLW